MDERSGSGSRTKAATGTLASVVVVVIAVLVWLWPIGIGGAMPVGGDVTQFSMGLMAVLREAIRDARLPLWNDRWGYGFPGLAESQMGVYYPPHLVLYGLLPVETAYTASLVLHVLWAGLGARWAARRFGVSEAGAALSGIVWATSGFFLIHLPHQWSYTVGSWCPWAWGLAWSILRGQGGRNAPWWLAAVLTVQLLPGHFQLAFCTQVGLLLMVLAAMATASGDRRATVRRAFGVLPPIAAAFPMAASQVVPTLQLARLAETQRSYEYLSGFATSPLHLVSLVAPGLFHHSPLWRPVAWDPFHTSPEEHLASIGLVPLFLAIGGLIRGGQGEGNRIAARSLAVLAVGGILLSLGPYGPGFSIYSQWPGFSFFRAPTRWALISGLALSILAGLGLDAIRGGHWRWPGVGLLAFVIGSAAWIAAVVAVFEVGLRSFDPDATGGSWVGTAYQRAFDLLPWEHDATVDEVFARARRPQNDLFVRAAQARHGLGPVPVGGLRLDRQRGTIYRAELGPTVALLATLLVLAMLSRHRAWFLVGLLLVTAIDLELMARHRPLDSAPMRPLTEQSTVLEYLAALPRGTRSIDPMRNLPMVAGAAPVDSYRTIDLPAAPALTALAGLIPSGPEQARASIEAQRIVGARLRIIGPIDRAIEADALADRLSIPGRDDERSIIRDPALLGWLFSAAYADTPAGRRARFLAIDTGEAPRAVLVPGSRLPTESLDRLGLETLAVAPPLAIDRHDPEHLSMTVETDGPALVIVSQLDYPEWSARLVESDGSVSPAPIVRVLDGWQGVRIPGPGRRTLRLDYQGRAARIGLWISAVSWIAWGVSLVLTTFRIRISFLNGFSRRNPIR